MKKRICVIMVLLMGASLLMGCEKKSVEYMKEDTQEGNLGEGVSGLEQFADAKKWEDAWTVALKDGSTWTVKVDANIILPEEESMSVIEFKTREWNEASREQMASNIFGNTKEKESGTGEGSYIGQRDGKDFHLVIQSAEEEKAGWISYYPVEINDFIPRELNVTGADHVEYWGASVAFASSNKCALTEEQAMEQALQMLELAGYGNVECMESYPLQWTSYFATEQENVWTTEETVNGYVLYFHEKMEDVPTECFADFMGDPGTWSNGGSDTFSFHIICYVTEEGVMVMDIKNPVDILSVTDDVNLLPLSTVKDLIKEQITTHGDDYSCGAQCTYHSLRLSYELYVDREREGYYSFVPEWVLETYNGYYVMINAIDGSIYY